MATREIITTIALDGEKEFKRELAAAGRELRVLGSELKVAQAEFENAGDEQSFLTNKSRILRKELDQQEAIVKALEGALADANRKWGEGSSNADGYAIQLNNARAKAEKMRKELDRTEKELKGVGAEMDDATKDTKQLGNALTNELENGAEDARNSLEALRDSLNDLRNMKGIEIGVDIAGQAWDLVQELMSFANENREGIRNTRLTDYRAMSAGYDPEVIQEMVNYAASITGDKEAAQSAYGMLTAVPDMSEGWMSAWSNMLLGASLKIPELAFDQLAEGLQETLSNRVLAGPFLELLERSGYNEAQVDLVNEQLKAARTLEDAMNVVMTPLATADVVEGGGSYAEFLRMYMAGNQDLIDAEKAEQDLAQAMNDLAEELLPITTFLTGTLADFIGVVTGFIAEAKNDTKEFVTEELPVAFSPDPEVGTGERLKAAFGWNQFTDDLNTLSELWFGKSNGAGKEIYSEPIGPIPAPDTTGAIEAIQEVETELDTLEKDASTTGANVGANLSTNIDASTPAAVASAQALADQVSAVLNSIAMPSIAGMVAGAMGSIGAVQRTSVGVININGRKVGQILTPTISTNQARSVR